jgi:hypothetical protein
MLARLITRGVAVAVLVGALGGAAAKASDYCAPCYAYKKVVCYETVICYKTYEEPYEVCVVKYDHCGNPYKVYETHYRTVKVPYEKQVPYVKYVKVAVNS